MVALLSAYLMPRPASLFFKLIMTSDTPPAGVATTGGGALAGANVGSSVVSVTAGFSADTALVRACNLAIFFSIFFAFDSIAAATWLWTPSCFAASRSCCRPKV